jgi:DNA polymerase IV
MDEPSEDALEGKRKFYAVQDALLVDSDEKPDPGREASVKAMGKPVQGSNSSGRRQPNSITRSISDTKADRPAKKILNPPKRAETSIETSSSTAKQAPLNTSLTASPKSNMKAPATSKTTGKRKRANEVKPIRNENGLFKDLRFYFFPNNDKHPARKIRIAKALEHGAGWEKDFNENVTHIIMDKTTEFGLLLKYLKRDSIPPAIAVVNEDYPAECLTYRRVLNPWKVPFKVKGYTMPEQNSPVSHGEEKSMPLKPAGKSVMSRQPETPEDGQSAPSSPVSPERERSPDRPPPAAPSERAKAPATNVRSTEEFDAAIRQARQLQDVPLDADDDAGSRPTSSEGPDTDDEDGALGRIFLQQKKSKFQRMQDRFQCMQKHTGNNNENPNAATIAILQQMADYYGQTGDEWRIRAYRKAIATLRNHPTKVWTKEEALALPQIGERLAAKIEEIALTNRLRRLDSAKAEPTDQVLQTFMQIYGVGPAQASKWVDAGYKTLDELLEKAELTENQKIGIEHYEDFKARIPRAEVEKHGDIVKRTLQKIDPAFEVIVGGSYRRGSSDSGDIDCIITRPETGGDYIRQTVLEKLVPKLFAKKFLVAELAATSRDDGSKWHGASQIPSDGAPNPWRRIDFLLVPSDELGAALIYFTGNDIFNRSMRLLAGTKGMRLNQRGLYKDVIRGKGREKLSEGTLVEGKDEKKIFEILGVPWRPPQHRIC